MTNQEEDNLQPQPTQQLQDYDERRDNMDYHAAKQIVSDVKDKVRDISEDATPEDLALIAELMDAQTNHEKDIRASMNLVYNVEVTNYSEDYDYDKKLRVKAVGQYRENPEIVEPEQNGQFGKWNMDKSRGQTSNYNEQPATSVSAQLTYRNNILVEFKVYDYRKFLQFNGDEPEQED